MGDFEDLTTVLTSNFILLWYLSAVLTYVMLFFSLKIAPGAMVCAESELKGDVTVGESSTALSRRVKSKHIISFIPIVLSMKRSSAGLCL